MTLSIWRYSHLFLALFSSLFLIVASITGAILAFEPISYSGQPFAIHNLSEVSLEHTVVALENRYDEVLSLEVDANNFVLASVITEEGNSLEAYIDPATAEAIGEPLEKAPIFEITTNFHRSLFLKSTGRIIVGIFTFFLCLMVVSGFMLLLKRHGGVRQLFSKVHKENASEYYHVVLSKWLLIPILLIALSGVYLSVEKFGWLPSASVTHAELPVITEENVTYSSRNYAPFHAISLSQLKRLEFPFSTDPEDYFLVELQDKELLVHQYTGEVLSEADYPLVRLFSDISMSLHTGRGNVLWSVILLIASSSILFFLYTGIAIFIRRKRNSSYALPETLGQDECEIIILVGSETGTTFRFAAALCNALYQAGKTAFVAEMNAYTTYQKARHLVVLTATYGNGEATTNARRFEQLVQDRPPSQPLSYSVVGFGSLDYPHFCAFAEQTDVLLGAIDRFSATTALAKINKGSVAAFLSWANDWSTQIGFAIDLSVIQKEIKPEKRYTFQVVDQTPLNADDTFLMQLSTDARIEFTSGDLLKVYWSEEEEARLYSIARIGKHILLSIKKHEFGKCSTFLSQLNRSDTFQASIQKNEHFHFPGTTKKVVMIANGTGIAPFLGMLKAHAHQVPTVLFWGIRSNSSLDIYQTMGFSFHEKSLATESHLAYSFNNKQYVQHLVEKEAVLVVETLKQGGTIMICGAIQMQNEVLELLDNLAGDLPNPLSYYEQNGQLRMDCY